MKVKLKGPKFRAFLKNGIIACIIAAIIAALCYAADYLSADIVLPILLNL